jgi:acetolactate synthase regulatory subunit
MSNREELNQRISSFNSLLEKMKIDPETIKIKVIKDNYSNINTLRTKLNKVYDELTLYYQLEVEEMQTKDIYQPQFNR